ncbi:MAG TPA: HD domain-containing phosphohydrolase [Chloroflexota bacterium]|jgi:HD-GYP domain-containing protein (c-di-GMP phosphodiesterase class II)|nr:HD domain-containing phosphohydrolase [Chloroflexota bacterium]
MRRVAVGELEPGVVLARAVYSERGELLLNADAVLTERYIDVLRERGFSTVFVADGDTSDLGIEDIISERVRVTVTAKLCRLYQVMERATAAYRDAPPATVEQELHAGDFARAVRDHSAYDALQQDIEEIVDEVLAADVLKGIRTLRGFDSYQFIHALDSTAVAVMLGRRLHYPPAELKRLAGGCLLHDIGMVLVDRSIQQKAGRLNPDELLVLRRHPQLGYEILRKLRPTEFLANHVAYQHHERQDGTGYPRGLHGTNRVYRAAVERSASVRSGIVLDAEIVAVADVYDGLSSDRPHRTAYPPDQAVRIMRRLGGSHLNREVVNQLLAVLPIYPLGSDVVVMTGRYTRYRGIVSRVHPEDLDRPTVRLLFDPERRRIEPVEIDLRQSDEVVASTPLAPTEVAAAPAR